MKQVLHIVKSNLASVTAGAVVIVLFAIAFTYAYIRNEATVIGYRLGELKDSEAALIEKKNHLSMELAKITTKIELEKLSLHRDQKK